MSKTAFRFAFMITILSVFLFAGSTILFTANAFAVKTGKVNTTAVNIRSGPGTEYGKVGTVKKGLRLEILGQKAGWLKVRIWKMIGWVKSDYLSTTVRVAGIGDSSETGSYTGKNIIVNSLTANIRSGPGTGYEIISGAKKGQQFIVLGDSSGWYKISLGGTKTGWIFSGLVNAVPQQDDSTDSGNDTVTGKYLIIKGSSVNVRSGPGTSYSVVATVKTPEKYVIIQQQGEWYKINLSDQKQGWVAGWVVEVRTGSIPSRGDTDENRPTVPDNGEGKPDGSANTGETDSSDESDNPVQKLTDIKYEKGENGTEKVLVTGAGPIQYSIAALKDPLRLVIDIKDSDANGLKDVESNGNLLKKIRVAQYAISPMAVRLVLDLNKSADYVPYLSQDGRSFTIVLSEPTIRGKVIVVDAGHGEYDPGAVGVTGLKEKEFNLETALLLRDKLTALGATVIMTREDDQFISLTERCRIANDAKADIFVSIHANASTSPSLKGTSTYFYAPSDNAGLYAQFEQRERLARLVQTNMVNLMGTRDIGILQENFAVLRGTNMPSILVESAFLSNADDELLLKDSAFLDKEAQGIADGLVEYFSDKD